LVAAAERRGERGGAAKRQDDSDEADARHVCIVARISAAREAWRLRDEDVDPGLAPPGPLARSPYVTLLANLDRRASLDMTIRRQEPFGFDLGWFDVQSSKVDRLSSGRNGRVVFTLIAPLS